MQCLILAGGKGTRMYPATKDTPKSLLPVNGVAFVEHQLGLLAGQGVTDVILSIGHLGEQVRERVGDGGPWGVSIRYTEDAIGLSGTGGAVRRAVDAGLTADGFFVLYGDSYLPIDYAPVWRAAGDGARPLMTVFKNDGRYDASNVIFADSRVRLYEKGRPDAAEIGMTHIDYGLSVLTAEAVREHLPADGQSDLVDLFHALSLSGELAGFEVSQRFYEIGSPEGLADLEIYLGSRL